MDSDGAVRHAIHHYVAISVAIADLYAWPNAAYPHKIAFRRGVVLHEVNRFGKQIMAEVAV